MDLPANEAGGKSRRFFTDLDTKSHVHITVRAPNLSSLDVGTYAIRGFREFFGITPDMNGIMWQKFDLGGIPGCFIKLREHSLRDPAPVLRCTNCGEAYNLTSDSFVVTDQDLEDRILKSGGKIIRTSGSEKPKPRPDLVMRSGGSAAGGKCLHKVIDDLRTGSYRRWACDKCRFVQGYPGSFFRYELP